MAFTSGLGRRFGCFSDVIHVVYGGLSAWMLEHGVLEGFIASLIGYTLYQIGDLMMGEHWRETLGDIIEYLTGFLMVLLL